MLKEIVSRIDARLQELGLSAAGASKRAGLNADFIRDLQRSLDGRGAARHGLTLKPALALARALNVRVEWLALGMGPKEEAAAGIGAVVPLVSWVAAGQPATGLDDMGDWPLVETGPLPAGDWIALEVRGDSMDRVAPEGAVLFVNLKERQPVERGLYVFGIGAETTFKQWRGGAKGQPPQLAPLSTNPEHLSLALPPNGRIIGRVRRVTKDW